MKTVTITVTNSPDATNTTVTEDTQSRDTQPVETIPATLKENTFKLSGTVRETDGTILKGVSVKLNNNVEVKTNNEGYYEFKDLQDMSYTVTLKYDSYDIYNSSVNVNKDTVNNITLMKKKKDFVVNGKVVDSKSGTAISGATIKLVNTNISVITDENGIFSFKIETFGVYSLIADMKEYITLQQKINVNQSELPNIKLVKLDDSKSIIDLNEITKLSEPKIIIPRANSTINSIAFNIDWEDVENADSYQLFVREINTNKLIIDGLNLTDSHYNLWLSEYSRKIQNKFSYRIAVKAIADKTDETWSVVDNVTIDNSVSIPIIDGYTGSFKVNQGEIFRLPGTITSMTNIEIVTVQIQGKSEPVDRKTPNALFYKLNNLEVNTGKLRMAEGKYNLILWVKTCGFNSMCVGNMTLVVKPNPNKPSVLGFNGIFQIDQGESFVLPGKISANANITDITVDILQNTANDIYIRPMTQSYDLSNNKIDTSAIKPGTYTIDLWVNTENYLYAVEKNGSIQIIIKSVTPSDWAKPSIEDIKNKDLIDPSLFEKIVKYPQDSLTRAEFCEMVVSFYESFENPVVKCDLSKAKNFTDLVGLNEMEINSIRKANALGIVIGMSNTEFAPNKLIDRAALATMLRQTFYAIYGNKIDMSAANWKKKFADEKNFPKWAVESVRFANALDILIGGGNSFNAYELATHEMAFVLIDKANTQFRKLATERTFKIRAGNSNGIKNYDDCYLDYYFNNIKIGTVIKSCIIWESSNPSIGSIKGNRLTAEGKGTIDLSATFEGIRNTVQIKLNKQIVIKVEDTLPKSTQNDQSIDGTFNYYNQNVSLGTLDFTKLSYSARYTLDSKSYDAYYSRANNEYIFVDVISGNIVIDDASYRKLFIAAFVNTNEFKEFVKTFKKNSHDLAMIIIQNYIARLGCSEAGRFAGSLGNVAAYTDSLKKDIADKLNKDQVNGINEVIKIIYTTDLPLVLFNAESILNNSLVSLNNKVVNCEEAFNIFNNSIYAINTWNNCYKFVEEVIADELPKNLLESLNICYSLGVSAAIKSLENVIWSSYELLPWARPSQNNLKKYLDSVELSNKLEKINLILNTMNLIIDMCQKPDVFGVFIKGINSKTKSGMSLEEAIPEALGLALKGTDLAVKYVQYINLKPSDALEIAAVKDILLNSYEYLQFRVQRQPMIDDLYKANTPCLYTPDEVYFSYGNIGLGKNNYWRYKK